MGWKSVFVTCNLVTLVLLFRGSPGEQVSCVKEEEIGAVDVRACREYKMMVVGKVDGPS